MELKNAVVEKQHKMNTEQPSKFNDAAIDGAGMDADSDRLDNAASLGEKTTNRSEFSEPRNNDAVKMKPTDFYSRANRDMRKKRTNRIGPDAPYKNKMSTKNNTNCTFSYYSLFRHHYLLVH